LDQLITVEIFGQPYKFKAEAEVKDAQEIAKYLMDEVSKAENQLNVHSPNISKFAILILAALNITNDHFKLKQNYSDLLNRISEKSLNLINLLDNNSMHSVQTEQRMPSP
jgi:cell division protein ZapA (FtsZ GTPase activity inhibitor)